MSAKVLFGMAAGLRPVDESTRLDLQRQIEDFVSGQDSDLSFPASLSNHDRAVVHTLCRKYGLKSKSSGKGVNRYLNIWKPSGQAGLSDVHTVSLNSAAQSALQQHFQMHPATEEDIEASFAGQDVTAAASIAAVRGEGSSKAKGNRPSVKIIPKEPCKSDVVQASQAAADAFLQTKAGKRIHTTKTSLPIFSFRSEVLSAVHQQQVIIVAGETGCGKTTQVPQYVLEAEAAAGRPCRILCSQPRRISAVSVASRVAAERGEGVGASVGYAIRLESVAGPNTALMFVTTGVLLKALSDEDALAGVTHVVVDEVHERDRNSDFALILLRDLLPRRPDLRVILMSATPQISLFSGYFGGCQVIRVPGFTYEVQDYYLEDVLQLLGMTNGAPGTDKGRRAGPHPAPNVPPEATAAAHAAIYTALAENTDAAFAALLDAVTAHATPDGKFPLLDTQHPETGATALMVAAARAHAHTTAALLRLGADTAVRANKGMTALDWATRSGGAASAAAEALREHEAQASEVEAGAAATAALAAYHASTDQDRVDIRLIERLLRYLYAVGEHSGGDAIAGDVLVFLPGWDEISTLKERLEAAASPFASSYYMVLPLHSQIAPEEQRRVFQETPGRRKLILATNVAETAVTIDGVVCVVNSGRAKEKRFDPYSGVSTLQTTWISRASERQRRGRAGRTRTGVAFHMYSRQRAESFQEHQLPELQRCPLEELCLVARLVDPGVRAPLATFLAKAPEPPLPQAAELAVRLLQDIGALTAAEELTTLGHHLAALPLPPQLGKLILYGLLFRCLDPVVTVACSMSYRSPWIIPLGDDGRKRLNITKQQFAAAAGAASDHLVLVRVFAEWAALPPHAQHGFASRNFLSPATMAMLARMRDQILKQLRTQGLIERDMDVASLSENAHDVAVLRCVLACGLYPNVAEVDHTDRSNGARGRRQGLAVRTRKAEAVSTAPSSSLGVTSAKVRFGPRGLPTHLVAYEEVTRGEAGSLTVQAATCAPDVPVLLIASRLTTGSAEAASSDSDCEDGGAAMRGAEGGATFHLAMVDGWLRWRIADEVTLRHLACLRLRLHEAFAHCCQRGFRHFPRRLQGAVAAAAAIFAEEGVADQDPAPAGRRVRGRGNVANGHSQGRQRRGPPGYGRGQMGQRGGARQQAGRGARGGRYHPHPPASPY